MSVVLVVMGVSGAGKSTVAQLISDQLHWELQEGDKLHPKANVTKMTLGQPLTDDDRRPWLQIIADWISERLDEGLPGIVTCSALKRVYRNILRQDFKSRVIFVHLNGTKKQIEDRLTTRSDHFMPASLLESQLYTLEPLDVDEINASSLVVNIDEKSASQLVVEIIDRLQLKCN